MGVKEEELKGLKETILKMASLVESSIRDSVKSLVERNLLLAERVVKNDHMINAYDVRIDEECIRLIARRQPVGKDLRFITTGMKITTDLERIADHAVNIAERSVELNSDAPLKIDNDICRLREIAQLMVKDAIDSFVNEDKALARDVIGRDDIVDALNASIIRELLSLMLKNPDRIVHANKLTYISKNIERIADHATNIAEMVIYMAEGRMIRHMSDINVNDNEQNPQTT